MGGDGDGLNGYTVIKEGEAEILMHSSNTVFFNKAQVNNRDMSIAVLRTFIEKRKEEYTAVLCGKVISETRINEATSTSSTMKKADTVDGEETVIGLDVNSKGIHQEQENGSVDASDGISKRMSVSGFGEPKAPKVLEALAASGLRALRYAREVEGLGSVIALDNDEVPVISCLGPLMTFLRSKYESAFFVQKNWHLMSRALCAPASVTAGRSNYESTILQQSRGDLKSSRLVWRCWWIVGKRVRGDYF